MKLLKFLSFIFLFYACAPSRYVKPLEKNQKAASFTFGGPLIKFSGAPIPIPFSTLGYAQGINENLTLYGNLHTTSALFGNSQLDLGTTFNLFKKENAFGITASPALQLAYSVRNKTGFRLWPSLDLNGYLHIKEKPSYLYAGLNSWFEFSSTRAHEEPQQRHLIPNVHIGFTRVRTKWQHQFELKYLGIGIPNLPGVVDYVGASHKGSFGIYYSVTRKF
ncbi:MAG: hypothetical protein JNL60_06515 [Bacteroidia bacterium]|nr:hypothetical protein [Bacteroidia bacterium]